MQTKSSSTILEQITKMTERGLQFNDIQFADKILRFVGYYPVVNAYKAPFIDSGEFYQPNVHFEDVYNLYAFDQQQRRIIQSALEAVELMLREISGRAFINAYGDDPSAYLEITNYTNIRNQRKRSKFLGKVGFANTQADFDPYKHYVDTYVGIPLWVAMTAWDFGTLVHFIKFQKANIKAEIAKDFFDTEFIRSGSASQSDFLGNALDLFIKFRNRVAHGNRVYNYRPMTKDSSGALRPIIPYTEAFHNAFSISREQYQAGFGQGDIYTLLRILSRLQYDEPKNILLNGTLDNLIMHLKANRELDWHLLQSLGMTTSEKVSFVTLVTNRNQLLYAQKKITDIYQYVPAVAPNTLIVDVSDTSTGLFNSSPFK